MAKIGSLEVESIKIANGALTTFYGPATNTGLTVTTASPNPTKLFIRARADDPGDEVTVWRTRSGNASRIGKVGPSAFPTGNNIRGLVVDAAPQNGDRYSVTGASGIGYVISAVVDWR